MFIQKNNSLKNMIYNMIYFFFRYPAPSNIGFLWNFGISALIFFIVQLLTGIFLSMHYVANVDYAFVSVENIMRNVNFGWVIRYLHANGASFFFLFVYLHFFRNIYYMSYLPPRKFVWLTGMLIMLLMIITAFTGYVLPWGQMSFWAATVITNLFSAVPLVGDEIVKLLWGNYSVSNSTLNRFYTFHFILPFILLFIIAIHFVYLHEKGSSNPLSVLSKNDQCHFHPYYTVKDAFVGCLVFILFLYFVAFMPNLLGHPDNYIGADPLVTPPHIVPEWYFLFFYAILRSIPSKLGGIAILALSIIILFMLPFFFKDYRHNTDIFNTKVYNKLTSVSSNYKNEKIFKWVLLFFDKDFLLNVLFYVFFCDCIALSILGAYPAEGIYLMLSRFFTLLYFLYFIACMWIINLDTSSVVSSTNFLDEDSDDDDDEKTKDDRFAPINFDEEPINPITFQFYF